MHPSNIWYNEPNIIMYCFDEKDNFFFRRERPFPQKKNLERKSTHRNPKKKHINRTVRTAVTFLKCNFLFFPYKQTEHKYYYENSKL